jgi:hypothetical protein
LAKNGGDREKQAECVHQLMDELLGKFLEIHQEESEEEAELSGEGIETIVCKNLHEHIFVKSEDDVKLQEIIEKHQKFL